jgi:hypothetical protein
MWSPVRVDVDMEVKIHIVCLLAYDSASSEVASGLGRRQDSFQGTK